MLNSYEAIVPPGIVPVFAIEPAWPVVKPLTTSVQSWPPVAPSSAGMYVEPLVPLSARPRLQVVLSISIASGMFVMLRRPQSVAATSSPRETGTPSLLVPTKGRTEREASIVLVDGG